MSPDAIAKLTIGEVEAICERGAKAIAQFREVQALLGIAGVPVSQPGAPIAGVPAVVRGAGIANLLSPEERQRRASLLAQFDKDGMPISDEVSQ